MSSDVVKQGHADMAGFWSIFQRGKGGGRTAEGSAVRLRITEMVDGALFGWGPEIDDFAAHLVDVASAQVKADKISIDPIEGAYLMTFTTTDTARFLKAVAETLRASPMRDMVAVTVEEREPGESWWREVEMKALLAS